MSNSAVQVAIVGAGFGGLCMAARLKRAGIDSFVVLERAADVGGVWWSNSYPGAACDLESRLYSFSFARDFAWSRSHGTRDEILAYLRHCVTKFHLAAHLRLGVDVEEARFDPARSLWLIRTATGEEIEARTLVSALAMERGFVVQKSAEVRGQREAAALAFLARQVKDEAKRRKLTPTIAIGCKRNIRSSDFLAALDRPNVDIVTDAIARIDGRFIETENGQRIKADALIYGTGFTPQEFLSTLRVVGPDGHDLHQAWQGAPEAYFGMTVAGFPNFFMIYGPNTNAMNSIVFMIECQVGYILQAIRALTRGGARRIDVRPDTQARFNAELQAELRDTSWTTGCASYFMNAAGRIVTQWPKATRFYWMRTRRLDPRDFTMET